MNEETKEKLEEAMSYSSANRDSSYVIDYVKELIKEERERTIAEIESRMPDEATFAAWGDEYHMKTWNICRAQALQAIDKVKNNE